MKTSGIIRKIDELGRIVLPKELRKYLNISPGDDFQINIEDQKIILEKYSRLSNIKTELIDIVNIFQNITNYKIYLIINNEISNLNNEQINNKIQNIIQERKLYINESNEISISQNIIEKGKIVINPIIYNSDILGTIIVVGDNTSNIINTSKLLSEIIKMKFM